MFKPTLLSRAVERAYGIEHPIGDPFGGAAYGARDKGNFGQILSSIVPMVAGAAMMLTPAAPMGAMLIGGAMMAGGAMSGIGALTGNKTLSKIGGITSAVAGVAGLGYSVYSNWDSISSFFSEGAKLTDTANTVTAATDTGNALNTVSTPSTASNIVNTPSSMAPTVSGAYQSTATAPITTSGSLLGPSGSTIPGVTSGTSFTTPGSLLSSGGANAISNTNALTSIPGLSQGSLLNPSAESALNLNQLLGGGGSTIPGVTPGTSFQMPPSLLGNSGSTIPGVTGAPTGTGVSSNILQNFKYIPPPGTTPPPSDGGGILSSVGNFINKNPVVSLMGLNTVAGLAEGASPKSQAEGELLQAQQALAAAQANYINSGRSKEAEIEFNRAKAYEQEKRDAYNLSITQMQAPNVNAALQNYNPGGLINGARA